MPPKKRISVKRKSHIPYFAPMRSLCPSACAITRLIPDFRSFCKVLGRRRRGDRPLESPSAPGVCRRLLSFKECPYQIACDDRKPCRKDPRAYRRHELKREISGRVIEIPPRHALIAQDEHRKIKD